MTDQFARKINSQDRHISIPRGSDLSRTRGSKPHIAVYLIVIVVLQGPFASALRILGYYLSNERLSAAIWTDVASALVAIGGIIAALRSSARLHRTAIFGTLSFTGVIVILLGNYVVGTEHAAHLGHWNSPLDEISRTIFILSLYIMVFIWNSRSNLGVPLWIAYTYIACVLSMFAISVLQMYDALPNFYFQWVRGVHMPRPAGGMTHPHFYAALNAFGIACALYLNRVRSIGAVSALSLSVIFLIGSAISTSRVGMVFSFIVFTMLCMHIYAGNMSSRYIVRGVIGLWALLLFGVIFYAFDVTSVERYYSMFFSFLEQESGLLRGRDNYWKLEIDLIFEDLKTLMFGYGFQPMVSHNLILRQLQATGAIGTLLYMAGLLSLFLDCLRRTDPALKTCAYMCAVPIAIASTTLPILVSTSVNGALLLVLTLLIGNQAARYERSSRNNPYARPSNRRRY